MNSALKIGIIGAGAAGLTAAQTLREKGYENITLFERADHPGGKCRSIDYEGRSYELGAGVIAENYKTIIELAKKFNVKIEAVKFAKDVKLNSISGKIMEQETSLREQLRFGAELIRYWKLCRRFKKHIEPGLTNMEAEWCVPFSQLVTEHNIPRIAKTFALFYTAFGYGYFEEVPAAYVLKHYSLGTLKAFKDKLIYKFPDGIQSLWNAIAKTHNIVYNTTLKTIRRGEKVTIQTQDNEYECDVLILTSPLDEAPNYLDASNEEKELFSKIQHVDYRTIACIIKNFPKRTGYIPGNFNPARTGHPVFWYLRYPDSDLYTFYTIGDWKITDQEAMGNIKSVVQQQGGTIEKNIINLHWKFFPHVSPEIMKSGYFDRLEALQGKNHTYYAGELLNFSTTDSSASYSKKLIEKYF